MFGWFRRRLTAYTQGWLAQAMREAESNGSSWPVQPTERPVPGPTLGQVADGLLRPLGAARFTPAPYINGSYAEKRSRNADDGPGLAHWTDEQEPWRCPVCPWSSFHGPAIAAHRRAGHRSPQ